MKAIDVLGTPLRATDYAGLIEYCRQAATEAQATAVDFANTHVVALARHDPAFRATLEKFDLVLPDGMPLVWSLNRRLPAGNRLTDRVYGPNFMLRLLTATQNDQTARHFLLGGPLSLLDRLRAEMTVRFPGLQITGAHAPPFGTWDDAENERIFTAIRASGARFVWVGLGCPKQEDWIARQKDRLPPAVYFAVGAAFAFHAGLVAQAPRWMQDRGLEWLYRIIAEPRRLLRRYLLFNSLFLFYLCKDASLGGQRSRRTHA